MPLPTVRAQFCTFFDAKLGDELLAAHAEVKRNFHQGGHRLAEVEGGRFCEAVFRILQQHTTGSYTPLGTQVDSEKTINALANLPGAAFPDSIRIHIPRALRLVYDIRNKRDAAHLADGIDPNVQDSGLVLAVVDWTLSELLRLFHNVAPNEAQRIVEEIVTRSVPTIEDFGGFPKVLKKGVRAGDYLLLLLYHVGSKGASLEQLTSWAKPSMRKNIKTTLRRMEHENNLIHLQGPLYRITRAGISYVEQNRLLE